jgi:hypothetical protein
MGIHVRLPLAAVIGAFACYEAVNRSSPRA